MHQRDVCCNRERREAQRARKGIGPERQQQLARGVLVIREIRVLIAIDPVVDDHAATVVRVGHHEAAAADGVGPEERAAPVLVVLHDGVRIAEVVRRVAVPFQAPRRLVEERRIVRVGTDEKVLLENLERRR